MGHNRAIRPDSAGPLRPSETREPSLNRPSLNGYLIRSAQSSQTFAVSANSTSRGSKEASSGALIWEKQAGVKQAARAPVLLLLRWITVVCQVLEKTGDFASRKSPCYGKPLAGNSLTELSKGSLAGIACAAGAIACD